MSRTLGPFQAVETYVHLGPGGTSVPLRVTDAFWEQLGSGALAHLGPGRLVSTYDFSENWAAWEKHPAGEEVVVLLAGKLDLVLEQKRGEKTVSLGAPGEFLIVPRDTWHTANVRKRALALFITAGEGTQHRARAPRALRS